LAADESAPSSQKVGLIGVAGSLQAQDLGAGEIRAAGRIRQGNSVWEYGKLLRGKSTFLVIAACFSQKSTGGRRAAIALHAHGRIAER
jgi:hypothetical protein